MFWQPKMGFRVGAVVIHCESPGQTILSQCTSTQLLSKFSSHPWMSSVSAQWVNQCGGGPLPGLTDPHAIFCPRNPAGFPRSKDGGYCQAMVVGKQPRNTCKPMRVAVLQWTFIYGQWYLNFIHFSHIMKYSSFIFFQPWTNIKGVLNLWLYKHSW